MSIYLLGFILYRQLKWLLLPPFAELKFFFFFNINIQRDSFPSKCSVDSECFVVSNQQDRTSFVSFITLKKIVSRKGQWGGIALWFYFTLHLSKSLAGKGLDSKEAEHLYYHCNNALFFHRIQEYTGKTRSAKVTEILVLSFCLKPPHHLLSFLLHLLSIVSSSVDASRLSLVFVSLRAGETL